MDLKGWGAHAACCSAEMEGEREALLRELFALVDMRLGWCSFLMRDYELKKAGAMEGGVVDERGWGDQCRRSGCPGPQVQRPRSVPVRHNLPLSGV